MRIHRMKKINATMRPITQCVEDYILKELDRYAKEFGCSRAEIIRRILREYLTTTKHVEWSDSRTVDKISEDIHHVLAGLGNDLKVYVLEELVSQYKGAH